MDDSIEDYYAKYNIEDDPTPRAIENVFDHASTSDGAIDNVFGQAGTSDDVIDNIYGNDILGDNAVDNIYGNDILGDNAMDNIYSSDILYDDAVNNIYGSDILGDNAMDNIYGNIIPGDEVAESVGAQAAASDTPQVVTNSVSNPGVVAEVNPPAEGVQLDPSRVQVTYEAHPLYFPCRARDNEPIPQLIQNHGRRSRSSSSASSRISSSTGDYLESSASSQGFMSPNENDADDEIDSSVENDGDRGSLRPEDDSGDDFGDDECSDNETSMRIRRIPNYNRPKRSSPKSKRNRSAYDTSSESDESDEDVKENDGSSMSYGLEEVDNESVDLDNPCCEKGLRIDFVKEGFHSDYSEYTDTDNLEVGREEVVDYSSSSSDEVDSGDVDLITTIKRNYNRPTPICEPEVPQTATHISALPLEMIFYILRWVVTDQLDLASLERFSMVCRGFYICSRDSELWRSACLRVWGGMDEVVTLVPYSSWRTMYLSRPRVHFDGCYISKSVYMRYGEDKLRDRCYRPWSVVHNYKYLKFFPEGMVMLLRNQDKNRPISHYLNRNNRNPGFLMGYYRIQNDHLSLMFARNEMANNMRVREILYDISNGIVGESYRIELQLLSVRNWHNGVLVWRTYAIMNRHGYSSSETELDVKSQKYPPFWFTKFKDPPQFPVGPL